MRRVVITGIGLVTPIGNDLESTWSALLAGKNGAAPITHFDFSSVIWRRPSIACPCFHCRKRPRVK